jgi:hypothetical protein
VQINIEKFLTTILFILEKNAAFRSFFTGYKEKINKVTGEVVKLEKDYLVLMQDIWLSIFGSLVIQGLQLQNLS